MIKAGHCELQKRFACWSSFAICREPRPIWRQSWLMKSAWRQPISEVQAAVKRLESAKFIRNTEEGWKLQTAQEKNWTNERSGHTRSQAARAKRSREKSLATDL